MSDYQRLSVNINDESAQILRDVKDARGVTTTEAVRRAIGLLAFFETARRNNTKVWTEDEHGDRSQLHFM